MAEETPQPDYIQKLLDKGPQALAKAYQDILKKIQGGEILTPSEVKSFELLEKKLRGKPEEKAEPTGDNIVDTLQEVARHFVKSTRTVRRWIDGGMPKLTNGKFDLGQITLWVNKKQGKSGGEGKPIDAEGESGGAGQGKDYWDMRVKMAQAKQRELELQLRQGELIELTELEALLTPRAMVYRQGLVALEQILSPRLAAALGLPPESMRTMNAAIRQATREILENVLRPLTLSSGQVLEWEGPDA